MECAVKWIPLNLGRRQSSEYDSVSESEVGNVCRLMELSGCM